MLEERRRGKKGRVKKHVSIQKELRTREVTRREGKKERIIKHVYLHLLTMYFVI